MVQVQPTAFEPGSLPIEGYGPGFFRVGGQVHHGAVIVSRGGVVPWSGLDDLPALLTLAGQIDVLFLGIGPRLAPLPESLRQSLVDATIMPEVMTTPSAARSYNVTLSEGRRVACALLPI